MPIFYVNKIMFTNEIKTDVSLSFSIVMQHMGELLEEKPLNIENEGLLAKYAHRVNNVYPVRIFCTT